MKSKTIEIKRGNVVVKIYVATRFKHGRAYTEYKVADKPLRNLVGVVGDGSGCC